MSTSTDVELHTVLHSDEQYMPSDTSSKNDATTPADSASTEVMAVTTEEAPANAANSIPEGGYGWAVVSICALLTFWFNGIIGSWGVIQAALLRSKLTSTSTSTISFIGTLGLACIVAFGLFGVRVVRLLGARVAALLGVTLLALGEIASGLIKLGGGIGAAILAITIEAMISRVGIPWTFRILGLCSFATCGPAAWFIRERAPMGRVPFLDFSMFRNLPFTAIFCAGAIGTFALFVPPYFLPLVAESIGLSSSAGAGLVGGFNACTAVGRLFSGWLSDSIGPVNMFLLAMILNAVSMLAIWPVSNSLAPLVVFAMLNGLANGAFFTLYPVVVASTAARVENSDSGRVAIAMGMAISGWTGGYLMGVPIAGYLLQAPGLKVESSSGDVKSGTSIGPYRPAIFYAGGVALAAAAFTLIARLRLGQGIRKKV